MNEFDAIMAEFESTMDAFEQEIAAYEAEMRAYHEIIDTTGNEYDRAMSAYRGEGPTVPMGAD